MATHIALLKGVNIGGHKTIAMADLRKLCARLGFGEARTLLQSGNLVFRGSARKGAALERQLEEVVEKRLGIRTDVFVRDAKEWKAIVARNPFTSEARSDPSHLAVMFLGKAPQAGEVEALREAIAGPEQIRIIGREAYIYYPNGFARSRVTNVLIEKKLGARATGRNWNTVLKLEALVSA
jgi:uncharacterized protein (DUF1697 family)